MSSRAPVPVRSNTLSTWAGPLTMTTRRDSTASSVERISRQPGGVQEAELAEIEHERFDVLGNTVDGLLGHRHSREIELAVEDHACGLVAVLDPRLEPCSRFERRIRLSIGFGQPAKAS